MWRRTFYPQSANLTSTIKGPERKKRKHDNYTKVKKAQVASIYEEAVQRGVYPRVACLPGFLAIAGAMFLVPKRNTRGIEGIKERTRNGRQIEGIRLVESQRRLSLKLVGFEARMMTRKSVERALN